MVPRFYVPDLEDRTARSVRLPPEEAHHLTRVLRLGAGADVGIFNGRGVEWRGRVAEVNRDVVEVSLTEPHAAPQAAVALHLAQAVLKAEAMEQVVRDATMIGIATLQPLLTERTTVKASVLDRARERWQRVALASAKQCGAATLPAIEAVARLEDWAGAALPFPTFLLVEPGAAVAETITLRTVASRPSPRSAVLLVGPEGGWSPAERDRILAAGATPLTLSRMTLRADAVPITAAAALLALWDSPAAEGQAT